MKIMHGDLEKITDEIEVFRLEKNVIDHIKSDLETMTDEMVEKQGMGKWTAGYLAY
jgi:hypothetical protein